MNISIFLFSVVTMASAIIVRLLADSSVNKLYGFVLVQRKIARFPVMTLASVLAFIVVYQDLGFSAIVSALFLLAVLLVSFEYGLAFEARRCLGLREASLIEAWKKTNRLARHRKEIERMIVQAYLVRYCRPEIEHTKTKDLSQQISIARASGLDAQANHMSHIFTLRMMVEKYEKDHGPLDYDRDSVPGLYADPSPLA